MNIINAILATVILSSQAHALDVSNCVSVNCDNYRAEKAKFDSQLKSINCFGTGDAIKNCDQSMMAKITAEFEKKVAALFSSPNVSAAVKNDVYFDSLSNRFSGKTQNAPGVYELIPALTDVNIGIHSGQVLNYQTVVDRIVKIDPAGGDPKNANWYLTQWKKESPLMLNNVRKDPIITNSDYTDGYLGKPKFEINSPIDPKYGTETSLLIYKDPADNSNVFEIVSRNGYLNDVGGSNVFLSSSGMNNQQYSGFNNGIYLTYNGKVSRLKAKKKTVPGTESLAIGAAFTGFTAYYNPPNGGTPTNLFIQLNITDSRKENITHYDCYMHGDSVEIVSTLNVDNDFVTEAAAPGSPLIPKKYSLNKYLCHSLQRNFKCPAQYKGAVISSTGDDLSRWSITGLYTGLETQVARGKGIDNSSVGPVTGEVEVGVQYSNLRLIADSNETYKSCADVFKKEDERKYPNCNKGSFTDASGTKIDFSCGCGEVEGGQLQENGCYHKKSPIVSDSCRKGTFKNEQNQNVDFACNCGVIAGATFVGDGCYHKIAPNPATRGSFCENSKKTEWVCNGGVQKKSDGWVDVGESCYHRITGEACTK